MTGNKKYKLKEHPELEHRMGGWLYYLGRDAGYEMTENDIKWIEKNITTNPLFRAIEGKVQPYSHTNTYAYAAAFFQRFLDASQIPRNVNKLLIYTIGRCMDWDKTMYRAPIEPTRQFFIERWLHKAQRGG